MRLYHLYHYLSHWCDFFHIKNKLVITLPCQYYYYICRNQFGGGYTAVHSFHELLGDDDDDYDD